MALGKFNAETREYEDEPNQPTTEQSNKAREQAPASPKPTRGIGTFDHKTQAYVDTPEAPGPTYNVNQMARDPVIGSYVSMPQAAYDDIIDTIKNYRPYLFSNSAREKQFRGALIAALMGKV